MRGADPARTDGAVGPPVLVSDHVDGRSRSAVAAVRALALAGLRPIVTVTGTPGAAARSRCSAGTWRVPPVGTPGFRRTIGDRLAAEPGTVVLPASDAVLVDLDLPGAGLVDKAALPDRAAAAGLHVPPTREFASGADLLAAASSLEYPVVVKPSVKSGADQVTRRVADARALAAVVQPTSAGMVVQPVVTGAMRAVCGVLGGGADEGRLLAAVHQRYLRIWPPDCGTASAAVTTTADLELEERLPRLLKGHVGVFQVQLIGNAVIDVNPRVYGSLPLAVAAGANLPAIAHAAARGRAPDTVVRGAPGIRYRWLEGDVRSLLHGLRAGRLTPTDALRAVRPRRGTAHSVESLRDPAPLLSRLAEVAGAAWR